MKEILNKLPVRPKKPRENGLTMIMDKGLSLNQAEDFLSINKDYTDIIKLGFGTSIITPNTAKKIKIYKKNGMLVYAGGTLFEAFTIRNQIDNYKKYLDNIGLDMVEISDGVININHDKKCEIIADFSKDFRVISEVGSKDPKKDINSKIWIKYMQDEISAGSWKVIAESREGGNVGVCKIDGKIKSKLVKEIISSMPVEKILWEAPNKNQQVWFINNFGANVNLGNIASNEVISLECLRLGLRGDTFNNFLT
ncbi:MAG: phosphosulfolactate synthase [Flavobacteriales bacterium]|nr:phosphosulfolactate synthase [Flavobacteriales bacterium]|tara:strand:- start:10273 stop:11031 length:759 start_codon:yes stop_codon:yes gene_type:complete